MSSLSLVTKGVICKGKQNNICGDWTSEEKKQIRSALGIDGDKTEAKDGQIQNILSNQNRILGLIHENIYIDQTVYDSNSNLTSARLRIYSNSLSVGTDSDIIAIYEINCNSSGPGKFNTWQQRKI